MRNIFIIIFSIMMIFSSSCAMKKVVLRYLDVQNNVPAKTFSSASITKVSMQELCSITTKTGSALDDVELASILDVLQLKAPVFFLLAAFLFSWMTLHRMPSWATGYFRQPAISFFSVPIYLKLRRLVYYA